MGPKKKFGPKKKMGRKDPPIWPKRPNSKIGPKRPRPKRPGRNDSGPKRPRVRNGLGPKRPATIVDSFDYLKSQIASFKRYFCFHGFYYLSFRIKLWFKFFISFETRHDKTCYVNYKRQRRRSASLMRICIPNSETCVRFYSWAGRFDSCISHNSEVGFLSSWLMAIVPC